MDVRDIYRWFDIMVLVVAVCSQAILFIVTRMTRDFLVRMDLLDFMLGGILVEGG